MKKHTSLLAICLLTALACTFLTGCNLFAAKEQTFSKAGMEIVLTTNFVEKEFAKQTAYYESQKSIVTALKEEFALFEDAGLTADISLEDYAALIIEGHSTIDAEIKETDGLTCFTYEQQVNGKNYTYFAVVYKGSDAYWLIQFCCETSNYDSFSDQFIKWAKSVSV